GHSPVGKHGPHGHNAVEHVKRVGDPGPAARHVNHALGVDACKGHALEPIVNVLVVVAGVLDPKYGQEVGGSKPNRVRYFSHPVANLLQQLVEGQVLIQVGCRWEAI